MKDKLRQAVCMWGACVMPLWAHAPYVEPYKRVTTFAAAAALGVLTVVLLRWPRALWRRVLIGAFVSLFVWLFGRVIGIITSL